MLFLENSSIAIRLFMRKAHTLGLPTKITGKDSRTEGAVVSHHPAYPAFSSEFVAYFTEREQRIKQIQERIKTLRKQMEDLQMKESSSSSTLSQLSIKVEKSKTVIDADRKMLVLMFQTFKILNPNLSPKASLKSVLSRITNEEENNKPLQNGSHVHEPTSQSSSIGVGRKRFSRVQVYRASEESSSNDSVHDAISKSQTRPCTKMTCTSNSSLPGPISLKK
ncbi:hypothetical protein Ciccas_003052 [Cichlidogyrus casuarinus]|uniref:Uncharacterized protein n=1 Tax=Cichlidogyrus casuarinus TaxID=1844966 RepID=A0ABD2QIR1_9PLAT